MDYRVPAEAGNLVGQRGLPGSGFSERIMEADGPVGRGTDIHRSSAETPRGSVVESDCDSPAAWLATSPRSNGGARGSAVGGRKPKAERQSFPTAWKVNMPFTVYLACSLLRFVLHQLVIGL
mgnify:CR=1 FL=1